MPQQMRTLFLSLLLSSVILHTLAAPMLAAAGDAKTLADLPPQTQAGISAAIGLNDADYHARRSSDGFTAVNSDHRLSASFSAAGATIATGTDSWTLRLTAFGRENDQQPVAPAVVGTDANRVEYRRQQVTEWYVNGPVGLEQGFTIPTRPSGSSDRQLVITLAGSGLTPVSAGAGTLSLTRADGSEAFRYGGLAAWDADGKALPVQLALAGGQVNLKVDDRGARYPVTVDPVFQSDRLTLNVDGAANDHFGNSVALSGDGNTALIGAYSKTIGANTGQGAAYVLIRSGTYWSYQARLTAADGTANNYFGYSVALSADGSTALIGAYSKNIGATAGQGAAYAYTRSGSAWSQQSLLSASDGAASDYFGYSVAISGDGNTALVGAYSKTIGTNTGQGAAYTFSRTGAAWSQQDRFTATDGAVNDFFGQSVALSTDGSTALIGAFNKTIGANAGQGAAYVFARTGSTWSQQTGLTAADGASSDSFGVSVALSADGSTALIGAYTKTIGSNLGQGAAYVYTRSGSAWNQQTRLAAADGAVNDYFGTSVALSADGTIALVGAYNKAIGLNVGQGAAYAFSHSGNFWGQSRLTATDGATSDLFGIDVALSADGNTALVGAYTKTIGTNASQGAAYAFTHSGVSWIPETRLTASAGATVDRFGFSVALSADGNTALVGANNKTIGANASQGAAYVFSRSGSTWTWNPQAGLTASDGAASDFFGISVALSADGSTALVGAYIKTIGANASQGAVYAFTRSGTTWSQQFRLTASDGAAYDFFGTSVALSADGSTALVGAQNKTIGTNTGQGAAYTFSRTGAAWSQQDRFTATDGAASDFFGNSVALSADGSTALVGAYTKTIGTNAGQGAAYAFTRSGSAWNPQTRLTATDGAVSDCFGVSVALSADGSTALVGAYTKTIGSNLGQGAAYVYTRSGSAWNQQTRLAAADGAVNDYFGTSVALSADGTIALVGAYNKAIGLNVGQGAAYAFSHSGNFWGQSRLTATDGAASDTFGKSVMLSADGSTALVGAFFKSISATNSTNQGATYTFEFYPQRCVAGSYDNGSVCTPCIPGTYQPVGLQTSCLQAPPGFYVAFPGATSAYTCPAGYYQTQPGQTSCMLCPVGMYQPSPGQAACILAQPGYIVATTGATAQTACGAGTAQSVSGQMSCTACAAGTLQPASGQSACVAIPKAANSVAYDPLNLLHLFAGIDNAGIYFSADGGTTWTAATTQPANNRVKALVLKPGDASKQFAATYGGGVFTSADSGLTWTACASNPANLNVVSLTIDATGKLYAGSEAGVFTSADGCATAWTALNRGLPQ